MAKTERKTRSLTARVADAVKRRGAATIDDMVVDFPEVERKKLSAALANARDARLLRVKVPGRRHQPPSVWEAGAHMPSPLPTVKPMRAIPSVWALGNPLDCDAEWPPLPAGRVIEKLGAWDVPETVS